jgi:hypothetical protein
MNTIAVERRSNSHWDASVNKPSVSVLSRAVVVCRRVQKPADDAVAETPLIVQHVSAGFRAFLVLDDQWWRRPEGRGAPIHGGASGHRTRRRANAG